MDNIFKDVFKQLLGDNPLSLNKPVEPQSEDSIHDVITSWHNKTKKDKEKEKTKAVKSDDLRKVDKKLKKDKVVEINPISKRFTNDNVNDKNKKLSMDEYSGKNTVEIESTAIGEPIRYNKATGEVWLRFKDKHGKPTGKWYHYVNMDEDQFKSFMKSASKGRYVTKIMKYANHDPAYPMKK